MLEVYAADVFKLDSDFSEQYEYTLNEEVENISRVLPTIARGLRWNVDDPAGASPAQELQTSATSGKTSSHPRQIAKSTFMSPLPSLRTSNCQSTLTTILLQKVSSKRV